MGDFIDRTYLISEKYLDQIKSASFTFMISDSGMTYDFSDDNAKKEVLKHYEDISDYNEENLADNTIYKIGESGWEVEDSEGFELEEVQSGNTYNQSYLGIMDINYRIYEDKENGKFIGFIKPHLQGDIRGGYGTGFIIIGDDKEEMFYDIYANYISGFGSIQIEFDDGATLLFDSQQENDSWSFELLDKNSNYENSSIAKDYINDWEESKYSDSFLEETVEMANSEPRNSVYALGGSVEDNEPRAYIVSLSDYNDGKSIGKWIDISTFADGDDVMAEINNFLEELNKKDDGNREEYAVHDYEGIGKSFYSESMGEEDFDEIINAYSDLEYADYPIEVIEEYRDEKMGDSHDFSDVLRQMEQEDRGNYSDKEDFAYQLVEEGVIVPSIHNLDVSETDIRLIAGEESDNAVYDLDNNYEDAIDQAQMSSDYEFEKEQIEERIEELENEISTLEEQLEDVEGEDYDVSSEQLSDAESSLVDEEGALQDLEEEWGKKAIESIRDEVYDDIEDKLNNNLGDYLDEMGYGEQPHKANFVIVDYESIADDLEQDHDFFESNDGTLYVFSNYKEGGTVIEKVSYDYFIVDKLKDPRIVKGYKTKAEAQSDASKHKGKKLKVINRNSAKKKGLPVDDVSMFSSSVLDLDGKPNLGIKAVGGKIKNIAKGVGKRAGRVGRGIQDQWREADFGDGKGKAEFFAIGGEPMSREEIVGKYKEGTLFDDKGNLVIDKEKMYQIIYLHDRHQNPNKYAMDRGGSAKYPRGYYPKIEFWGEKIVEGANDELIDNVTEAQESASHFIEQQDKLENPQKYQPKEKTPQEERKMSAWYKFVKKHKGSGKTLKQLGAEFKKKTNKYVDGGETIDPHHLYCNYCVRKAMDTGKLDIEEDDYNEFIWENDSLSNEDRQKLENKLKDYATYPQAVQDVMGIHAFTGCENCIDEQKAGFKPHTFTDPKAYRQNMEDYGERLDSDYEDGGEIGITTGTAYYITNDSAGNDYDSLEQNVLESKKEFNNLIDEGKILEFYFNIKVKYDWQIVQAIYQQMADDNLSQDNNHIIGYSISLSVSGFSPSMPYNVDEDDDDYKRGGGVDGLSITQRYNKVITDIALGRKGIGTHAKRVNSPSKLTKANWKVLIDNANGDEKFARLSVHGYFDGVGSDYIEDSSEYEDDDYKKGGRTSYYGGGVTSKLWFDDILQGHEATEQNAYDRAFGMDWMQVETHRASYPYLDYIETVNGVEIYYNYGDNSYYFADATDSEKIDRLIKNTYKDSESGDFVYRLNVNATNLQELILEASDIDELDSWLRTEMQTNSGVELPNGEVYWGADIIDHLENYSKGGGAYMPLYRLSVVDDSGREQYDYINIPYIASAKNIAEQKYNEYKADGIEVALEKRVGEIDNYEYETIKSFDPEEDDYADGGEIPEEGTYIYITKDDSEVEVYNEETQELIRGGFETFNEADDWANRNNLEISWRQDEEDEGYDDGGSVKKKFQFEDIDYDSLEYGKGGAVKSKKIITQKLGLTDEIADQLIGMSEKFAVWIANQQLDSLGRSYDLQNFGKKDEHWEWKDIPKEHRNSRKTTAEQLSNIKAVSLFSSSDPKVYRSQDYRQVLDWLQYPTTPKQNLRELTMEQALVEAEEWHEALTTTGGDINYVEPEENVILHSYPVDEQGVEYYWIQMPTNFCDIESSRMGHCGRTGYDNNLISLRSKRQHLEGNTISDSHVTIAYSPNDGKFYQVKGKKNQKPAEKYHDKIFDLIMIMAEDDSWKRNNERLEQEGRESGRREEKLRKEAKEINKEIESELTFTLGGASSTEAKAYKRYPYYSPDYNKSTIRYWHRFNGTTGKDYDYEKEIRELNEKLE